ncbi:MAG: hypothetical protein C6P37_11035 [Caldibacillus debilis]|uniref:Uncharacterized protein n=1 Tax=Caldibacillus debilis TaxID=301148 RepID=A0A3E0K372_9BACI|nr:MAG: hypothetical protein C6P37_11035 [Caldibacillus debilis]
MGIFPIDTVINLKRAEKFSGLFLPKATCGKAGKTAEDPLSGSSFIFLTRRERRMMKGRFKIYRFLMEFFRRNVFKFFHISV